MKVYGREAWPLVPGASVSPRRFRSDVYELSCDVVVVGSGSGGAVVASELAEGGLDVIVLEEGGHYRTRDFSTDAADMLEKLYRDGGAQMALGTPPVTFAEGRCVGGSTVINGGMTWRTPERVLERWGVEHGLDGVDPASMLPVFERVERFLSAAHQDPGTVGRDNELLREGAERKGWEVVKNIRNQLHCAGTNNCAFGCPTGAKRSTLVSYLPRAVHFGARVISDCRVDRVLRRRKRVVGVEGHLVGGGERVRVHAREVVVSCGAVQTPALLMRSGIRSRSGNLGRNLTLHPNTKVAAVFDDVVDGYKGVHQAYQVREFQREGFVFAAVNIPPSLLAMTMPYYGQELLDLLRAYDRTVIAGVLIEDTTSGRVRTVGGVPVTSYQLNAQDHERILRATSLVCDMLFEVGAKRIVLPFEGVPDLMGPDEVRRLFSSKIPLSAMEVVTVHIMGTAAMGADPARHVCDPYGRFYDLAGLSVADASLFPTPIGVNPMETIMALATRCAGRLLETCGAFPATARA